jgi:hypothetical protein
VREGLTTAPAIPTIPLDDLRIYAKSVEHLIPLTRSQQQRLALETAHALRPGEPALPPPTYVPSPRNPFLEAAELERWGHTGDARRMLDEQVAAELDRLALADPQVAEHHVRRGADSAPTVPASPPTPRGRIGLGKASPRAPSMLWVGGGLAYGAGASFVGPRIRSPQRHLVVQMPGASRDDSLAQVPLLPPSRPATAPATSGGRRSSGGVVRRGPDLGPPVVPTATGPLADSAPRIGTVPRHMRQPARQPARSGGVQAWQLLSPRASRLAGRAPEELRVQGRRKPDLFGTGSEY